jgi:hypothetical protein
MRTCESTETLTLGSWNDVRRRWGNMQLLLGQYSYRTVSNGPEAVRIFCSAFSLMPIHNTNNWEQITAMWWEDRQQMDLYILYETFFVRQKLQRWRWGEVLTTFPTNLTHTHTHTQNVRLSDTGYVVPVHAMKAYRKNRDMGFVVDKVVLGQVFLRVLRFSPINFIPPVLHY